MGTLAAEVSRTRVTSQNHKMKIAIILSVIALALAKDFNLEFEENGVKFVEKIKIDVAGQTEEYSVPKHMDRAAADVLKDFGKELNAEKVIAKKACYISEIPTGEDKPKVAEKDMERLEMVGSKFPSSRYEVVNKMVFPYGEMSPEEVGQDRSSLRRHEARQGPRH